MKKRNILFICVLIIVAISSISIYAISSKSQIDKSAKIAKLKKDFNMDVSINNDNSKISKQAAYEIAENYTNNLSKEANHVSIDHYFVTYNGITPAALSKEAKDANSSLNNGINKTPVWIVTYEGLSIQGHSFPGTPPPIVTTNSIVVDATTGQVLWGFKY